MSLALAQYTSPGLVLPCLRTRSTKAVIAELCAALEREHRVGDSLGFFDAILRREQLCSSATPSGWAFPHARLASLPRLSYAVGLSQGIRWLERGPLIRTVFLFAVPESDTTAYMSVLSCLARLSMDSGFVTMLQEANDSHAVYEAFGQIPLSRNYRAAFPTKVLDRVVDEGGRSL